MKNSSLKSDASYSIHCLVATNLGFQYVFKTERALSQVKIVERCYLCSKEKEKYQIK